MARPTTYERALKVCTIRLTEQQMVYLERIGKGNLARGVRSLADRGLLKEKSGDGDKT